MVRPPTKKNICLLCKGSRLLCGKRRCPILLKTSILKSLVPFEIGKTQRNIEIFGASPPGFFVGRYNYPNVSIGPLVPFREFEKDLKIEDYHILDSPETWFGTTMTEIIKYRSSLVRSNFKMNVKIGLNTIQNNLPLKIKRMLEVSQELSMAARPVDTEAKLEKMRLRLIMDNHSLPVGPSGIAEKIEIAENVKVHPKVDYCVSDTDLKAKDAIWEYLYKKGKVPDSTIVRIFSAGLLGEKEQRKLVPTRWAITAVDDMISKGLIEQIKKFPEINDYRIFEAKYLDNHFKILLFPGKFAYEMNEGGAPNSLWNISIDNITKKPEPAIMTDYEFYNGRKTYASNITGAYYAARKAICEYLFKIKRQARILVIREVSAGYLVPLGVWVIRETVKHALENMKPVILDNFNDSLKIMTDNLIVERKYWEKSSKLINFIKKQRTLDDFF
ncbi:MAG: Nre family DNA repair protein [Promethearchaeota archaeon]